MVKYSDNTIYSDKSVPYRDSILPWKILHLKKSSKNNDSLVRSDTNFCPRILQDIARLKIFKFFAKVLHHLVFINMGS